MKKSLSPNIKAEGNIIFKMVNTSTGEATSYKVHNVCTAGIPVALTRGFRTQLFTPGPSGPYGNPVPVKFQVGSGTSEPSAADTALGSLMWQVEAATVNMVLNPTGTQLISTITFIVPADASYTGTFSEVGLMLESGLATHALLKDAEDNPFTITKTDLDQLTVTYVVTITVSGALDAPALSWVDGGNVGRIRDLTSQYVSDMSVYRDGTAALYISARRRKIFVKNGMFYVPVEITALHGITAAVMGDRTTRTVVIPVTRLPAASYVMNGHFIFSAGLVTCGTNSLTPSIANITDQNRFCPRDVINFPDHDVMPVATLREYAVGAGDGVATDFIPPIPAWLAETETIYIDGVAQTRNVDYTCDNLHNLQKNIELTPLFQSAIIDGHLGTPANYPYIGSIRCADKSQIRRQGTAEEYLACRVYQAATPHTYQWLYMTNDHPYIIEMPIGEINMSFAVATIYLWSYYAKDRNAANSDDFTIEYSSDGETWTTALNEVAGAASNHSTSHYPHSHDLDNGWVKYDLPQAITAKYWRISAHMIGATQYHNRFGMVFLNAGQKIVFNNPPSSGAAITMDCQIDVPYKDDQHVVDLSLTYTL